MQYIIDINKNDNQIKVLVPCKNKGDLKEEKVKNFFNVLRKSNWTLEPIERLSLDQMKLIFALCRDYGEEFLGYTTEETRQLMKAEFTTLKQYPNFSCSPQKSTACSMEVATEFIQFIIEHALNMGKVLYIPVGHGKEKYYKSAREVVPEIGRYVIACLRNKVCAVCGKTTEQAYIDLHHWDNVARIGGYKHDDGLKTRFISLCREHHAEFHNIGEKPFSNKYHLEGVYLSANIVADLRRENTYPNHFKAFKMEMVEPCDVLKNGKGC